MDPAVLFGLLGLLVHEIHTGHQTHSKKFLTGNIQYLFPDILPWIPDDPIGPGSPGSPGGPGIAMQGPENKMTGKPLGKHYGCM